MYGDKESNYFSKPRIDIQPLIKFKPEASVLEIGCGVGSTLIWLKKTGKCHYVTGIDAFATSGDTTTIDEFINFDLNCGLPQNLTVKYDAILCLDVLEHLTDPWEIANSLKNLLNENGQLIVSLPNIQNYKVVLSLLFKGNFNYEKEGILDKTHLRFFTIKTGIKMLQDAGFIVEKVVSPDKLTFAKRLLSKIGLLNIITKQFIISCTIEKK